MPIELHWLRPEALLLLPLVLLLPWWSGRLNTTARGWEQLIAKHLLSALALEHSPQRSTWRLGLALVLLLSIVALAGPSWQRLPQPAYNLKRGTVVLMDMSLSMHATDVKPDRLSLARFKAIDFAARQAEGDMALISFAGDAFVIAPLTPDHQNISMMIPMLKPEIMPVQGSDLLSALRMADKLLQQAGYPRGDVVAFTDGFASDQATQLRDFINDYPHRLSVVAFGTLEGAPVKLEQGNLLKDRQGSIVLPKVPLQQLRQLAEETGGLFSQARFDTADIDAIAKLPPLEQDQQKQQDSRFKGDQWQDGGIWLVWLLLPIALLWLRKAPLFVVAVLLLQPLSAPPLQAQEQTQPPATTATEGSAHPSSSASTSTLFEQARSWLWDTPTETAKQLYDNARFEEAQQAFTDPLWQGNAAYRQGDFKTAAELFRQANSVEAQFNLGNALAQQHDYQQALKTYQQVQQQAPSLKGLTENIDLMKQLLAAKEQQNQQGDQKPQDGQPNQPQQDSQQGDPKQNQSQQDNAEQGQSPQQGQASEQPSNEQDGTAKQQASKPQQAQQQQAELAKDQTSAKEQQVEAINEAWPNATPEQSQQLDAILRKVQDDPYQLLHNKMVNEYQRRNAQAPQTGDNEEW